MSVLLAPLLVSEIWARVNDFLAGRARPPLCGEPPPLDLGNRSGRTILGELASTISTPSASWPVVMSISSEITLPSGLMPAKVVAPTSAITAAAPPRPPAVAHPRSLLLLGGLIGALALLSIHLCPFVRHNLVTPKSNHLYSAETPISPNSPPPRFVLIPVLVPDSGAGARHFSLRRHDKKSGEGNGHHRRHHGARHALGQSLDSQLGPTSWPTMCSFADPRPRHDGQKPAQIQKQIPLPPDLQPGSAAAKRWAQAACIRARREMLQNK